MDDVHYSGTAICVNNDMYRFNLHIETIMYLEDELNYILEKVHFYY